MDCDTAYRLPQAGTTWSHELEIKRSRFLTYIRRVSDERSARAFLDEVRAQHPTARHHCSAYIYHVPAAQPVERSSDDGEPSGTAGRPMLEQLRGSGMLDIAAVVVRYFGGIKLGAGGLVHAYSNSVGETLPLVAQVERARQEIYTVELSHSDAGRHLAEVRQRGISLLDVSYAAQVTATLGCVPGGRPQLDAALAAITGGKARLQAAGEDWVER
ncbi:YigZ family protein [Corynebacterium uberis]|uniref:YigZ family protein n=1 Tax=Corynebacterium TaxID=1716 RepID=UPI001D0B6EF0|nr:MULTISPECIES: YigZ family protein [Corynebacterium]MCZ9308349.1 YigZ family protein [Corynebacterium sp. c6VSa_13]UDL74021.1 YigZ family protein [Corynebacterium uberis]UDL75095.1 YigZ family protein [Corynebacterium uberis]UDL77308.1 YigZ family protein [Corynebacterium uberis]UDL79592.1 YigZ family protein [Corynebacterium uberis]